MSVTDSLLASFRCSSLMQTQALAHTLAQYLQCGDCLALYGDLGAGKTAFAAAVIAALSVEPPEVTSPSFTLLQSYPVQLRGQQSLCWHADLYRLEHVSELVELGLQERLEEGVLLVEWPEIARAELPASCLSIYLKMDAGQERQIEFYGDASWQLRLLELSATTLL